MEDVQTAATVLADFGIAYLMREIFLLRSMVEREIRATKTRLQRVEEALGLLPAT